MARTEAAMASLLRIGVATAALTVTAGGARFLATEGSALGRVDVFRGEPGSLRSVASIVSGAAHLDARSVIMLGLLVLIATPILRVMFSVVTFAVERDAVFVTVTIFVLAVLLFGITGPYRGVASIHGLPGAS